MTQKINPQELTEYNKIISDINNLLVFLNNLGIDASLKSNLEKDFLLANDFVENYNLKKSDKLTEQGRAALGGLHELYKWIWSIKESKDFYIVIPHLKMLSESATRINSKTEMMNSVTGKQDEKTNKLIETIVAMFAIKVGQNVEIDDPVKSSGGENPDILLDYNSRRIAIACKTIRGCSENTILDNLRTAKKQIERAKCDIGFLAINTMNILPHDKISHKVFDDLDEPFALLTNDLVTLYVSMQKNCSCELDEMFTGSKIRPVILSFVHSSTRLNSSIGILSTTIKGTLATPLGNCTNEDLEFLNLINEFIHNLEPKKTKVTSINLTGKQILF